MRPGEKKVISDTETREMTKDGLFINTKHYRDGTVKKNVMDVYDIGNTWEETIENGGVVKITQGSSIIKEAPHRTAIRKKLGDITKGHGGKLNKASRKEIRDVVTEYRIRHPKGR